MAHTGKARVKPPPDEPPAIEVAGDLAAAEEEAPPEEHEHAHEDHAGAAPPEAPPEEESADVVEEAPMEAAPEEAAAEAPPEEAAEAPPEEAPPEEAAEAAVEEAEPVEELAAPIEEPPYPVQLTVERGSSAGTAIALTGLSNILGGNGAGLSLGEDPHLASQHALLFFEDQKLLLRDEGAANGVYVKLRAESQLVPGDLFIAGERLLRFDGPVELTTGTAGDTPLQGAPRPQGTAFKISEVLKGGKVGRTAHRAGPVIAIGKTGCDLNFPADALLGARHAEVHLAEDGSATLHDLGAAPTGVFLRLRPQAAHEVIAGDVLQVGDQTVRVDF